MSFINLQHFIAQNMKFSIKDFFINIIQWIIRRWKRSMENFIFLCCVCCRILNIIKMNTNIATRWVNPLIPNALFFYSLKTSENRKVFWYFPGIEKGYIGNNWVNWIFFCNTRWHFLFLSCSWVCFVIKTKNRWHFITVNIL